MNRKSIVFSLIFLFFALSLNSGNINAGTSQPPTVQTNATDILINFDALPDLTNLTNAYSGVTFSSDWESWITSPPYTASSAPSVAYTYDFNNFINFDQAAKFVSVYVTNVEALPIFLEGSDSLGNLVTNATIPGNVEAFYVSISSDIANIASIHFNYAPTSNARWVIDDLFVSLNLITTAYSEWITFDTVPDSTNLTNAYAGVTFSNDWLTWNTSAPFTASSAPFVAYSYDFNNFIKFDFPARYVSVYVTNVGTEPIPVEAYNATGGLIAIASIPANTETYFVLLASSADDISSIHFDYPSADDGQWIIDDLSWGANQPLTDKLAPVIDGNPDLFFEFGDPSAYVGWRITDTSAGSFVVYRNGTYVGSNSWTSIVFPGTDLTSYSTGTYEFKIVATDSWGNEASFVTIVSIRDTLAPVIDSFEELFFEVGDPSAYVGWRITDASAGSFVVYQNGTYVGSNDWTDIIFPGTDLSSYEIGTYEFQIVATDIHGNEASNTTIVYIRDTVSPVIGSTLVNYSYVFGETSNFLFWQPSDAYPGSYEIYRTSSTDVEVLVDSGVWSDTEQIALNIDGLDVGEYVYRAEFSDGSGNVGVAETIVTVEPVVVPSEPTGNTSDDPTTSEPTTTTTEPRTTTSEPNGTEDVTPDLPLPFSNIYLIIFSILGLTIISRKKKNFS